MRSRSHLISLKDGDGKWQKAMCLVPAADMLNMAVDTADANLECKTDTAAGLSLSQQRFLCTATRDIPAGTELMTVYAGSSMRRADGRLLLECVFSSCCLRPLTRCEHCSSDTHIRTRVQWDQSVARGSGLTCTVLMQVRIRAREQPELRGRCAAPIK